MKGSDKYDALLKTYPETISKEQLWKLCRISKRVANEHEEERMVVIIVSKALGDFDLVIKSLQFAGRYRIDGVSNQAIYPFFFDGTTT